MAGEELSELPEAVLKAQGDLDVVCHEYLDGLVAHLQGYVLMTGACDNGYGVLDLEMAWW